MNIFQADDRVFALLQEIDFMQRAMGEESFVDYNLSPLLPSSFKINKEDEYLYSEVVNRIRHITPASPHVHGDLSKRFRDEMLVSLYRQAYKDLGLIYDLTEFNQHPMGQVFKRQVRSKIGWLHNRIVVPEQALTFLELHQTCSQIDMTMDDTHLVEAMIFASEELLRAAAEAGLDINRYPRPEAWDSHSQTRNEEIDLCLHWINNYFTENLFNISTPRDLHIVKSLMEGHVKGVKTFLESSGRWGAPNFTFDVHHYATGSNGFLAWLVSDGTHFKQLLNVKLMDKVLDKVDARASAAKISEQVLLYNGIHEPSHMWAIGIQASHVKNGLFPGMGRMLKSFTLNNVIDTKAFFDESIGAACPLVWGVDGLADAEVRIAVWGRMLQKLAMARVLQHMVEHGQKSAEIFLERENAFNGTPIAIGKSTMNGLLDVQGNTYEPNLTLLYSRCIVEMIRLYKAAGREAFSDIIVDAVSCGYQDSHTFLDFLNKRGVQHQYETICKPITLPDPVSFCFLKLQTVPGADAADLDYQESRNEFGFSM